MKVRIVLFSLMLLVSSGISVAATISENIKDIASTAGKKVKEAGRYVGKLPEKVHGKLDKMITDYWGNMPFLTQVAHVRAGIALSGGEKQAVAKRMEHAAAAIENKFGKKSYTPKIALLSSGGGYRAMFVTLGFLSAAQKSGLLDMITWMAGVSGGAWGIGLVMAKALADQGDTDIAAFAQNQSQLLQNKTLKPSTKAEFKAIGNILLVQSMGHQLFTTINLFGAILANRIFSFLPEHDRQRQLISAQAELVKAGKWPIPIYTVVQYDPGLPVIDYRWVEFNPWEYGGTWMHSYAPIWGTSRSYHDGVSANFYPERSFGFILGMCGSAFAAEFQEIYQMMKEGLNPIARSVIERSLLPRYALSRATWGQLQNYSKGLSSSPIKDEVYLNLIDAGLAFNFPYPPLSGQRSERNPDILIFLDSSSTVVKEFCKVEQYAKKHKLKFPPIDYTDIDKRFISVFSDPEDKDVPVVIYLNRITDPSLLVELTDPKFKEYEKWVKGFDLNTCAKSGQCAMTNFAYSQQTIMQLIKTIEFQTMVAMPTIFEVIKQVIGRKSGSLFDKLKFW